MPTSRSSNRRIKPDPPWRSYRPLVLIRPAAVLAVVIATLPASLVAHFSPAFIHAEDHSGSLWHGSAGKISVNARDAGALEWSLHSLSQLGMSVVADALGQGELRGRGHGESRQAWLYGPRRQGWRPHRRSARRRSQSGMAGHRQFGFQRTVQIDAIAAEDGHAHRKQYWQHHQAVIQRRMRPFGLTRCRLRTKRLKRLARAHEFPAVSILHDG
jgi:hypothetical protein